MDHALLAPSSATRWMACTPSAKLELQFEDRAGVAAEEGTLAHKLGELLIRLELEPDHSKLEVLRRCILLVKEDPLYNESMLEYMEQYTAFVIERFAAAKALTPDAIIEQEVKLPIGKFTTELGAEGTGDNVIIADGTLEIIDLKYGKGVIVHAEQNAQMMLYALGALDLYDEWYQIDRVKMTIYQPRIDHFSTWVVLVRNLRQWADEVLKPAAVLALAGKGEFKTGDHCHFCKVRPVCKAQADYQLQVAQYDFLDPVLLQDTEVADIITRAKGFYNWIEAVEDYALKQAVLHGKQWPGFKLVEGKSNRKYGDPAQVAKVLLEHSQLTEDELYKKELFGITEITKLVGKKLFEEYVGPLLIKPPGKPALVPESDKRPALNSLDAARADFKDEIDAED